MYIMFHLQFLHAQKEAPNVHLIIFMKLQFNAILIIINNKCISVYEIQYFFSYKYHKTHQEVYQIGKFLPDISVVFKRTQIPWLFRRVNVVNVRTLRTEIPAQSLVCWKVCQIQWLHTADVYNRSLEQNLPVNTTNAWASWHSDKQSSTQYQYSCNNTVQLIDLWRKWSSNVPML